MSGQHRAPDALSPGQDTGTYGIRGSMGPGAGPEIVEYSLFPCRDSKPHILQLEG
jgi:hypothetical protein